MCHQYESFGHYQRVSSMIALTISLEFDLRAEMALARVQAACCITNSMSFSSTPSAGTSVSSSSSVIVA